MVAKSAFSKLIIKTAYDFLPEKYSKTWIMSK